MPIAVVANVAIVAIPIGGKHISSRLGMVVFVGEGAGRAVGILQEGNRAVRLIQDFLPALAAQGQLAFEAFRGDVAGIPGSRSFRTQDFRIWGVEGSHFRVLLVIG